MTSWFGDIFKLTAVTLCHGMRRGCPLLFSSVFLSSPPLISPHHLTSCPPFTSPSHLHCLPPLSLFITFVLSCPSLTLLFILLSAFWPVLFSFWVGLSVTKISDIKGWTLCACWQQRQSNHTGIKETIRQSCQREPLHNITWRINFNLGFSFTEIIFWSRTTTGKMTVYVLRFSFSLHWQKGVIWVGVSLILYKTLKVA